MGYDNDAGKTEPLGGSIPCKPSSEAVWMDKDEPTGALQSLNLQVANKRTMRCGTRMDQA